MSPLISVVMPVRGLDAYLQPAIDSILKQTVDEIELLLVVYPQDKNAFSGLCNDSRIKLIGRDKPGIVSALNTGIKHARGYFLARMDADDIALPTRFERQLEYLKKHPEVDITGACVRLFSDDQTIQGGNQRYQAWLNSLCSPDTITRNLFIESPLPHPTWFAKTSIFKALNGYRDCGWPEDYDLLLRAHLRGLGLGKPNDVLLLWREHNKRLTRTDSRYAKINFIKAKAWALSQSIALNRDVIICGTGRNATRLFDALTENGVSVVAFVEHDNAPKRNSRRHTPVITYTELEQTGKDALVVSAVSATGVREQLRHWFNQRDWHEWDDFVFAA